MEEYAVSSGIYCFFELLGSSAGTNALAGFKITDIDKTPNVTTVQKVRHQLSQGGWAKYVKTGEKEPGELTLNGFFEFTRGTPKGPEPSGFLSTISEGIDGVVKLAVVLPDDITKAQVFFRCDAIVTNDGGFGATLGELITTQTKFQLSGEPLLGTININEELDTGITTGGTIAKTSKKKNAGSSQLDQLA